MGKVFTPQLVDMITNHRLRCYILEHDIHIINLEMNDMILFTIGCNNDLETPKMFEGGDWCLCIIWRQKCFEGNI